MFYNIGLAEFLVGKNWNNACDTVYIREEDQDSMKKGVGRNEMWEEVEGIGIVSGASRRGECCNTMVTLRQVQNFKNEQF